MVRHFIGPTLHFITHQLSSGGKRKLTCLIKIEKIPIKKLTRGRGVKISKNRLTYVNVPLAQTINNFVKFITPACRGLKNQCTLFLDFFKKLSLKRYRDVKMKSCKMFF